MDKCQNAGDNAKNMKNDTFWKNKIKIKKCYVDFQKVIVIRKGIIEDRKNEWSDY